MAEKTFSSRTVHKHDIAANWQKTNNFIPMQGEIIVYDTDASCNYERFKIGNGYTEVNSLPFADEALKDYINTEITELSDGIGALGVLVGDTAVSAQINEAIEEISYPVESINGKTGAVELTAADVCADVWYVTVTKNDDGTHSADKTVAEIVAAYESGVTVCCNYTGLDGLVLTMQLSVVSYNNEVWENGNVIFTTWLESHCAELSIIGTEITFSLSHPFVQSGSLSIHLGNELIYTDWFPEDYPDVNIPDKMPNPNILTFTGAESKTYDGSEAVTVNIPAPVVIDADLGTEGAAADAKATGDAIAAIDALVGDTAVATQISEAIQNVATKSRTTTITIPSSAWINSVSAPYYTRSIACDIATSSNNLMVGLAYALDNNGSVLPMETYKAAAKAKLAVMSQGDGTLTFVAYGTRPTIAIPVSVMEVG